MDKTLDHDKILNLLIEHFINIGNSIAGKSYLANELKRFGEPLAIKAVQHIVTIQRLCTPHAFAHSEIVLQSIIDHPSIAVLTRTALETYLTFNYIFVAPKSYEVKELRYYCWDIAGYINRENFPVSTEENKQRLFEEQAEKKELLLIIEGNSLYRKMSPEGKKRLRQGNWKIFKNWRDLAREAGLSESYFTHIYAYLSDYCHSGRISAMQIEQSRDINTQKQMSDTLIQICLVILAYLIHDYTLFFPECKEIHSKNKEAEFYTTVYLNVGNRVEFQ
jgi:AraC-like DNA-binding protein